MLVQGLQGKEGGGGVGCCAGPFTKLEERGWDLLSQITCVTVLVQGSPRESTPKGWKQVCSAGSGASRKGEASGNAAFPEKLETKPFCVNEMENGPGKLGGKKQDKCGKPARVIFRPALWSQVCVVVVIMHDPPPTTTTPPLAIPSRLNPPFLS